MASVGTKKLPASPEFLLNNRKDTNVSNYMFMIILLSLLILYFVPTVLQYCYNNSIVELSRDPNNDNKPRLVPIDNYWTALYLLVLMSFFPIVCKTTVTCVKK